MEKLIITAAITGGSSPQGNPYLPKSPKEQIQASVDVWNAGLPLSTSTDGTPRRACPTMTRNTSAKLLRV
jgi:uncharacterized protein (DUF849 family)